MELKNIKPNPNNPRVIKDEKYKKLVNSVKGFPKMMAARPMVCVTDTDGKLYPLGGNMRYRVLKELGYKEIPDNWVKIVDDYTEDERKEFTIKDNVAFGEWDFDALANDWELHELEEWGIDVPQFAPEVDYSILDNTDLSDQLRDMAGGVKKAIQIEFSPEQYEEAYQIIKFWRERGADVGAMILEFLKAEKEGL